MIQIPCMTLFVYKNVTYGTREVYLLVVVPDNSPTRSPVVRLVMVKKDICFVMKKKKLTSVIL